MAAGMDKDPSKVVNDMYDMKDDDKSTAGQMLKQLYTTGSFQDNFGALVRVRHNKAYNKLAFSLN